MASFEVRLSTSAETDFLQVPFPIRRQINQRLFKLKQDPYPADCCRQPEISYITLAAYGWEVVYEVHEEDQIIVIYRIYR